MVIWRVWTDYDRGMTQAILQIESAMGKPLAHLSFDTADQMQELIDALEERKRDLKRKALSPFVAGARIPGLSL